MLRRFIIVIAALIAVAPRPEARVSTAQFDASDPGRTPQERVAPYTVQYEGHVTVRADRSASEVFTRRVKILSQSAVQAAGQQQLFYVEGMETLDTVEAFTEKADGRRIDVDPANIITRDAVSGLQTTYMRDRKQRTIIFSDLGVGDTIVMTHRKEIKQGLFPGQLMLGDIISRNVPYTLVQVTVESPVAVGLQLKATGEGVRDTIERSDDVIRHKITISPTRYEPAEAGAVSPVDRDPLILMSTFKSYEEMGLAYGQAAVTKAAVTPQITALADEITRGIDQRRAQAAAIDAWIKKNIRYVAVYLAQGRVVPNDANTVLRNKFGDCKDKATLMSALLAAKGIASESVLINLGNAYTLPEPPTLAALNHVVLYLPEFDLYDDPTAALAAFGVLPPEAYDKPVVRISANAATRARTPAMVPQDHTAHALTTINVAGDGTITGKTEETNTGFFAISLRLSAAGVQILGNETTAQRQLQRYNTPGTGRIDVGQTARLADPAIVGSSFKLTGHFKTPPAGGRTTVPYGLPLTVRPGNLLFGPRMNRRRSAFVCLAGRQIEDIEATFDEAWPMPVPLRGRVIDNPVFSYRSTFTVLGRTLNIHREFVSKVAHQSCPPELEAQIAGDLNLIRLDLTSTFTFNTARITPSPAKPAPRILQLTRAIPAGQQRRLDFFHSLNPDCSSLGFAAVRVLEEPTHGKLAVENGTAFPNYPQNNQRYECNRQQAEGVAVSYEPDPGFVGPDSATVDVIFASGFSGKRHYTIEVK